MATIDKRIGTTGSITWRARVRVHGQTRVATFKRKTDATNWASNVETDLSRGLYVPEKAEMRRSVSEMINRYIDEHLPTKRKNKDLTNPKRHLEWWEKQIGSTKLPRLTSDLITNTRNKLINGKTRTGENRTPGTCNRYLTTFSHCCATAVKWGWLKENPARHVDKLQEPKGRTRFLSEDERDRLLKACRESDDRNIYLAVVLALSTGMRASEIRFLTWNNVDLPRKRIILTDTKNNETRTIPLVGHAYDLMRQHIRRIGSPYVFAGRFKDRPAALRNPWDAAVEAAGLADFRFHDCRHTAASYLAMNGATLAELSEILGHKSLSMVKRYAHLTEQHTAKVVSRMNKKMFGAGHE
jgi:integrase